MSDLTKVLDVKFMNAKEFLTEYFGEKRQGWEIDLLKYPLLVYCNEGRVVCREPLNYGRFISFAQCTHIHSSKHRSKDKSIFSPCFLIACSFQKG